VASVVDIIQHRINELKYEKVHLRPFIESDKVRIAELDRAIAELEWVCSLLDKNESGKS